MAASGIEFHRRWIEQCEAAQRIKQWFGLSNALEYLVGEKLLHFAEASRTTPILRRNSRISWPRLSACSASLRSATTRCTLSVRSRLVHPSEPPSAQFHRCPRTSIRLKIRFRNQSLAP